MVGGFLEECCLPPLTGPSQGTAGWKRNSCLTDISFGLSLPQCRGGEGDVRASGNGDPGLWKVASLWLSEPLRAESRGL